MEIHPHIITDVPNSWQPSDLARTPDVEVNGCESSISFYSTRSLDTSDGTYISGTTTIPVFGVAKHANIIGIECMDDGSAGATSDDIMPAINLAANATASSGRPSITTMPIGGAANQPIDDCVIGFVNYNITFIVAVGNGGANASVTSPARLGGAGGNGGIITIGTSTTTDTCPSFNNFGPKVDLLAPGQEVLNYGIVSNIAVQNKSGTSMST